MNKTLLVSLTSFILAAVLFTYIFNKVIDAQEKFFKALSDGSLVESTRKFSSSLVMTDPEFWSLIEASKAAKPSHFQSQMDYLAKELSKLSNEQIAAFERTLREKMIVLWNYNVKSMFQIIFGEYIPDDGFVYFRLWIIANGQDFFNKAQENPELLADKISKVHDGIEFIKVADRAFELKNGRRHGLVFPSDLARDIDYEEGVFRMSGTYIHPKEFDDKYPLLSDKF